MKNTLIVILSLALAAVIAHKRHEAPGQFPGKSMTQASTGITATEKPALLPVRPPGQSDPAADQPSPEVEPAPAPAPAATDKKPAIAETAPKASSTTTAALPPVRQQASPTPSLADVLAKVMPGVVSVITDEPSARPHPAAWDGRAPNRRFQSPYDDGADEGDGFGRGPGRGQAQGLGSGVIFTADGYILTNYHVVSDAATIQVVTHNPEKRYPARLVGGDQDSDIAVLKIEATGLPAATLANGDPLRVGDTVLAIGNPFGLTQTVTSGIVSALGRSNLHITGYENFIQTDASINPGNSGGALIDTAGQVVGINTAIYSRSGGNVGVGFAIPISMAHQLGRQIIDHGKVRRGFLGVSIADSTDGTEVREVSTASPAAGAGLKQGDVVLKLNGQPVRDSAGLRSSIALTAPGTKITLRVRRGTQELDLTATVQEKPTQPRSTRRGMEHGFEREDGAGDAPKKNSPWWR